MQGCNGCVSFIATQQLSQLCYKYAARMDQILKNTEAKKQQFSAMDNQYDSIYHEIESLQQSTKLHLIEVERTIFSTNEKIAELELNSLRACADDALREKPAIPAVPISLVTIRKDYEQQRRIIRQAIMKGGQLLQRAKPNLANASVPSDDSTVCHTQSRILEKVWPAVLNPWVMGRLYFTRNKKAP